MSEWQSPQDFPRREPDGVRRLIGAVEKVSEKTREATSNLLRTAGIFVTQAGMRIASSLTVEGDLTSTGSADITGTTHIGGATDIDGTLNVDAEMSVGGDATFSGAMRIEGTLSLPAGIIDNEALANPLRYASAFGNSDTFAVPSSGETSQAIFTVEVPEGFTKASFIAEGAAGIYNTSGVPNYAYLRVRVLYPGGTTSFGTRNNVDIQVGHTRTLSALLVRQVPVALTGGDLLTFYVTIFADTALAANIGNFASAAALVTFTR